MTLRIDRSRVSPARALNLDNALDIAAQRRERNLAAQACINETKTGTHGKATHGVRCYRCHLVHKHGAGSVALAEVQP